MDWETEELLTRLENREWSFFQFGDRSRPETMRFLAGIRKRGPNADVFVLHSHRKAVAWCTPRYPADSDPFHPEGIWWHYAGIPKHTLRAVLTLCHEALARHLVPAPPECWLPPTQPRPFAYRPAQTPSG